VKIKISLSRETAASLFGALAGAAGALLLTVLFNTFFLLLLSMADRLLLPAFWLDEATLGADVMRGFFFGPGAVFARMLGVCPEEGAQLLSCQPGSFAFSGTAALLAAALGFALGWEKLSPSWKGPFLRTTAAVAGWFAFLLSGLFIASHAADVAIHTQVTGLAGFMAKNYAGAGAHASGWMYVKFMLPFAVFGLLLGADLLSFAKGEGFFVSKEWPRRIFSIWGGALAGYIIATAAAALFAAHGRQAPVFLLGLLPSAGLIWGALEFRPVHSAPARCFGFILGAGLGFAPLALMALQGKILNPGILALPALLMAAGLAAPELSALLPEEEPPEPEKKEDNKTEETPVAPAPEPIAEPEPKPATQPDESSETLRRFLAGTDLTAPPAREERDLCDEEKETEPPLPLTPKREEGVDYMYMEVDTEPESPDGYPSAGGTDDETDA